MIFIWVNVSIGEMLFANARGKVRAEVSSYKRCIFFTIVCSMIVVIVVEKFHNSTYIISQVFIFLLKIMQSSIFKFIGMTKLLIGVGIGAEIGAGLQ